MLNKNLLLPICIFIASHLSAQTILSFVDSTNVSNANIWGGISWNGAAINITTMNGGQIKLRKFDTSLNDLGTNVQLTFPSDYQGPNIADHKHIYLNGYIYIAFMTSGNKELYLLKTDSLGNRIQIVTLETMSNNTYLTNDMHLVTDSTYLYVVYPQALNYGTYKRVRKYSLNLDSVGTYTATSPILVAPLGTTFYKNNMFYMFTGNEDQHHLIVSRWGLDWTPQAIFFDTIINSTTGDWHYFSTGIAYDTANGLWYIAYHRMLLSAPPNYETIWLAVVDNNFNVLEDQQVTAPQHFRPHLLLHAGYLYMVYDGTGVVIKKYKVNTSSLSVSNVETNTHEIKVIPNPFSNELKIESNDKLICGKLYTQLGECLNTFNLQQTQTIDLSYLPAGLYCFKIEGTNFSKTVKIIKN